MTKKNNSSFKSGLVFSAAVAGSILGNYHRAYSLSCPNVTNNPAFGRLDTCDGAAGEATISITGDFAINNQLDGQDENAAIKIKNEIQDNVNNAVNVTLSSMTIESSNASGFLFFAAKGNLNGFNVDSDFSLTINEDVSINTTSDGLGGNYGFQEAVSINNSSDLGSSTIVINGDATTRGVDGGFDDAVRIYKFGLGETDITIGESSTIQAFDGGDALYSYGGDTSDVTVNISGDIYSEEGSAVVVLKGDSSIQTNALSAGNMTVNIGSNSAIESKKDAVFLFINSANTQDNDAKTINFTASGDITSTDGNAVTIDGSSRFDAKRDQITIEAGANLTGKTAAIHVKDNFSNISLTGGTNFASQLDADIVRLTGTDGVAIRLGGSTLQTSIHDNDVLDHITDFTDAGDHAVDNATDGNANHTINISGNVVVTGDIIGGESVADDNDIINLSNANLTLVGSDVTEFEAINIDGTNVINGDFNFNEMVMSNAQDSILELNGNITANILQVNDGLTLNGNFTLDGNIVASGGSTISPGATNSGIGTITVNGGVTFEPGSTLIIDVDGDNSDQFIVNGGLEIFDDTNLLINPIRSGSGSARVIQTTGGITGSFSNVLTTSGSNITLLYAANNLDLNYVNLDTAILSTQIQASVDSSMLFSDTLNKQITRGAFSKGRDFWVRNIYRDRDVDSSASRGDGFTDKSYGIAFGSETDLDESVRVGFAAASINSNVNVARGQGGRDGNSFFAAAYANYKTTSNLFASLALTLGYHDNENSRLVRNGGVDSFAKSNSHDKEIGLNLQFGKKFTIKEVWNIMPKFSVSYVKTLAGKFNEGASAGDSAISVENYELATLKFREGVRFERSNFLKFSNIEFSPFLEVGLAQERSMGDRKIVGTFSAAAERFTTKLKTNNRNFVTGTAGFNMKINKDVSAFVSYENAVNNQETRNDFNAGVSVKF